MALFTRNVKGQLADSPAALLTVDLSQTWIIQNITISNNSGSTVSGIKFYVYPNGGSAGNATQFVNIGSLTDDESRQISLKHNLGSQDVLAAEAGTATAVNYIVSYAQRTD